MIEEGKFTDRNGKVMNPRSLNSPLKSLGFKKSEVRKVLGKTKRCISIDQNHLNKVFKRYGFPSYEVTVVTVTMGTPQNNINSKTDPNSLSGYGSRGLHKDCNNRNLVTKSQFTDEEIKA